MPLGKNKILKYYAQGNGSIDEAIQLFDSLGNKIESVNCKGNYKPRFDDVFPGGVWNTKVGASAPGTSVITYGLGGFSHPVKAFDGVTTTEEMSNTIEIIHGIDIDSLNNESIKAEWHVHMGKTNTAAGTVLFTIQPTYLYANTSYEQMPIIPIYCTFDVGNQYSNLTFGTEFAKPSRGFSIGDIIIFNIYRDPTDVDDTYGYDALFYQTALHMPFNSRGSEERYIKY